MKIGAEFLRRRAHLLAEIGSEALAVVFAADGDDDFYYLTGFPEREAVAVFVPGRKDGEYLLFSLQNDADTVVWHGAVIGEERACQEYGVDQAFPLSLFGDKLAELMRGRKRIYCQLGKNCSQIVSSAQSVSDSRAGIMMPTEFVALSDIVHEMRLIKDNSEIDLLRQAADISAAAHIRAMQKCRPGMMEYELAAEVLYEFNRHEATESFPTIVGGGSNGCILHYENNNAKLQDGDLVLIDAGASYKRYKGDISRTFPVNGRFSKIQQEIYQAVLHTQLELIAAVKPGVSWMKLHQLSEDLLAAKLRSLGILHDGSVREFYTHYIGHWLGLDCHDVGLYKTAENWRLLEPGMVLTIEPGVYIKEQGIGIRIEDDILVTKDGAEVLTAAVPKTIAAIEALMN